MKPVRLLLPLIYLLTCLTVKGQWRTPQFEHLGVNEGLSSSYIVCIIQDKKGFIWLGTQDGLTRYDGYKFTTYKNDPANRNTISNNFITDIAEDKDGLFWIGTWGGGLNVFNPATEQFTSYKTGGRGSLSSNLVNRVMIDRQNKVWVSCQEGGLNCFDKNKKEFLNYIANSQSQGGLRNNNITIAVEKNDQQLYVGTQGAGLYLFNKKSGEFKPLNEELKNRKLEGSIVLNLYRDKNHLLWIGTEKKVAVLDETTNQLVDLPGLKEQPGLTRTIAFTKDPYGNLWLGGETDGIAVYDYQEKRFFAYKKSEYDDRALNDNLICAMLTDAKGNIWIGTHNEGLNIVNRDAELFTHYRHIAGSNSLAMSRVLTIAEGASNKIWIGTDGGGVDIFDPATGKFTNLHHDPSNENSIAGNAVSMIMKDRLGKMWIGTWGNGISIYDPETKRYRHFKNNPADPKSLGYNNIWSLYEDSRGWIWVGTYGGGLDRYDRKTNTFTHFTSNGIDDGLGTNNVMTVMEDRQGMIWIGTDGAGFSMYNPHTGKFTNYRSDPNDKNSISSNSVNAFYEDVNGNFWITTDAGLCFWERKKNQFTRYYTTDGLPNNTTIGILPDSAGNLWISSFGGLSRLDVAQKAFHNYGVSDGVQSTQFGYGFYKASNGLMYFGGKNGFNVFDPQKINPVKFDPPIVITAFQIFNKNIAPNPDTPQNSPLLRQISYTNDINISYSQSVVSFEFASLNYTKTDKKKYEYKLIGFDEHWNKVGTKNTATYTNLGPGKYVFVVRGLSNDGEWSQKEARINLTIEPAFWMTWWFRTSVVLVLVFGIAWLIRSRVRFINNHRRGLEKQVQDRTEKLRILSENERKSRREAEEANRAKTIFLATMSHEIRTPMNGVIGMASLLSETPLNEQQRMYTDTIISSGESLLNVINDILDFSKIESGKMELEKTDFDLRKCVESVLDLFASKANQIGIELIYQVDPTVPACIKGDSLRLKQVITNLVSNALKFTRKGEVYIGIYCQEILDNGEFKLAFEIRDTGIGIPADKLGRLFKAFTQVDSSTTRRYGGTGLGLAICEKLIHLMGGEIEVESEYGQGSTFRFTITASEGAMLYADEAGNLLEDIVHKKILVVDDNTTNRMILEQQLRQWDLVPVCAESGFQALDILASQPGIDLVVTDMKMPLMHGIELATRIRRHYPGLPIILLSSLGDEYSKTHPGLFNAELSKPVKHEVLRNHIAKALQKNPVQAEERNLKARLDERFSELHPLRILIAEDNHVNQQLIIHILARLGYDPVVVDHGKQAVDAVLQSPFDLILMDMQMPEMDGLVATREIRRLQLYKQPVIIALTANAMQGDREECLNAGMNDYLSKPVKLEELVNKLQKWAASYQA